LFFYDSAKRVIPLQLASLHCVICTGEDIFRQRKDMIRIQRNDRRNQYIKKKQSSKYFQNTGGASQMGRYLIENGADYPGNDKGDYIFP
jgi:hypothetical protein